MFKEWLNEMMRSKVRAHFLLIKNTTPNSYPIWGAYLLGPMGEKKFLWSKAASKENVRRELIQWASQNNYDGVDFEMEEH